MTDSSSQTHGRLFVISAPSGAGKTSLVRELVHTDPSVCFSISYTTRPARNGEVDGRDYHFVSPARFEEMIAAGEFLEHAEVFGNRYGTSRRQVELLMAAGRHVILEIDWQGAAQVRAAMPACTSVFVLPPSREELERRLRNRATDSDEVIAHRLSEARADMSHWHEFDYVVVNDDFTQALERLRAIVHGADEAWRSDRPEIAALVRDLLA
ncbi:MAG: guanylate kinase [Gammaproteobacteria bacterium]